jgi:uncharacterized membrane protein
VKRGWILGLAGLGFALSLWLELVHVRAYLAPSSTSFCTVGEKLDCTSVALSRYSVLLNVPVPLWGALGFVLIAIAAWLRSRWLLLLTGTAALASLALIGVELFAIGAFCLLCEAVHAVAFASFALAWQDRENLTSPITNRDDALVVFGPFIGVSIALALFVPRYWGAFSWKSEVPFSHGVTSEGYPWIGAKNPKLTLDEYTDYGCPHCKTVSTRNLKRLATHPDTLRIVRRQYPRNICLKDVKGLCPFVRAAYCAAEQGRFWQADRFLFEHGTTRPIATPEMLANAVGLDVGKLTTCMERNDIYERAENETRLAVKKKIQGTPALFIGDKRVTEETLNTLLEAR